jgi:hypothetical protein
MPKVTANTVASKAPTQSVEGPWMEKSGNGLVLAALMGTNMDESWPSRRNPVCNLCRPTSTAADILRAYVNNPHVTSSLKEYFV